MVTVGRSTGRFALAAFTALALAVALVPTLPAAPAHAAAPSSFTFEGSGWGHGIGMSQYGAYGQAQDGRSATQILEHYYAPARVTSMATDPVVLRVQVLNERSSVTVTAEPGRTLELVYGASVRRTGSAITFEVSGSEVVATINDQKFRTTGEHVVRWQGSYADSRGTARTVRVRHASANADPGDVHYKYGELRVGSLNGRPNVLNRVKLEEYLTGLAEMPSSWPAAALQAQAIAGRTFALRKQQAAPTNGYSVCRCDVRDEVTDQKFTGWNKGGEGVSAGALAMGQQGTWGARWEAAVEATAGRVVMHGGRLAETYYSSSTGGKTTAVSEAWGSNQTTYPYLASRDDHWSDNAANPYRSWTATLSQATVAQAFGLKDVVRLQVTRRASSGAVMQVRATSAAGQTKDLLERPRTDSVRTALGLRSPYFDIVEDPAAVERFSGADRYETAVLMGRAASPSSRTVVLVSGDQDSIVDGLVAAPLARSLGAPVLLAGKDGLPRATRDELDRRRVSTIYLVGGPGVLTSKLVSAVRARYPDVTMERLAGDDRFGTATAVARKMGPTDRAIFASGIQVNLIDSAAASGAAAATGQPILLVRREEVPAGVLDTARALGVRSGTVVGGSATVRQSARDDLHGVGISTKRAGGDDRYATAAAVADQFAAEVGTSTVLLSGAAELNMIDSLAGGALGHLTLLNHGGGARPATSAWFGRHDVDRIRVAGGTGVIPTGVVSILRRL